MSLYVEFNEFNVNIIIVTVWYIINTDPQFNVISCCIGQVLCKPWRVVELTACAGGCTVLTIPSSPLSSTFTSAICPWPLAVTTDPGERQITAATK